MEVNYFSLITHSIPRIISSYCQSIFCKYIDRKYILPMYKKAHSVYRKKISFGKYSWISVYKNLEISFQMSTRLCSEPSKIAIRNSQDDSISDVVLLVEAEGYFDDSLRDGNYTAQQNLKFENVNSNSTIIRKLSDIPPLDFWWIEDDSGVIFSYQYLSITVISVTERNICHKIDKKIRIIPFSQDRFLDDILKGNWREKSGRYFNIGSINQAKLDLKERISSDLAPSFTYLTEAEYLKINVFLRAYWKICEKINEARRYLLLQDKLISARFWILIILDQYRINEGGCIEFDQYSLYLIYRYKIIKILYFSIASFLLMTVACD
jgi:hypothetical protein